MLKVLQLGFSSTCTEDFQICKLGFEEAEEPEFKLLTFVESQRKQGNSRKNNSFCFIDYTKSYDCVAHNKLLKRWEYQTISPVSWETYMQVKNQQLELQMQQLTDSKLGKECKAVHCHSTYLTYL